MKKLPTTLEVLELHFRNNNVATIGGLALADLLNNLPEKLQILYLALGYFSKIQNLETSYEKHK
jgi:hypothetical protein